MNEVKPTILIVDDSKDILDIVVEVLTDEKFTVFGASSGEEALERLKEIPFPNLLLVDCFMAGMSGAAFIGEFESRYPESRPAVKIIGISGLLRGTESGRDFENLVDYYDMKPLDLDGWFDLLRKYL